MSRPRRDYNAIAHAVRTAIDPSASAADRMRIVVDALWDGLSGQGVSWVGYYLDQPGQPDDRRLVLGPCRDKPACSPIGLHGMCGKALMSKRTCVIDDVRTLGASYIACDPRDQSEIVVPLVDALERCWAVLDMDSGDVAAFDGTDDSGLRSVLQAADLTG